MKPEKLKEWISSLTDDIEFSYQGVNGAICPINCGQIYLSYGDDTYDAVSVDDAMQAKICGDKSLDEIAEQLEIF